MEIVLKTLVGIFVLVLLLSVSWRILSKWFLIPWPSFLAFWLENPYMKIFACEKTVVKKMGVEPGEKILEIGCGAARITKWLCREAGEEGFVHGLDLQVSMLTQAKKKLKDFKVQNYKLEHGDFLKVAFADKSFDRVVMVTVLGEIPDSKLVLDKVNAVLKSGGKLSVCEVIPDPCYIFSKDLIKLCSRSGFQLESLSKSLMCYVARFSKNS